VSDEYARWRASLNDPERPMSRAAMYERYEQLDFKIEQAKRQLEQAERIGDRISARRARRQLDHYDAEQTVLHQQLFPILTGHPLDPAEPNPLKCPTPACDFVFKDRRARWEAAACPRCLGQEVPPWDFNWKPTDRR